MVVVHHSDDREGVERLVSALEATENWARIEARAVPPTTSDEIPGGWDVVLVVWTDHVADSSTIRRVAQNALAAGRLALVVTGTAEVPTAYSGLGIPRSYVYKLVGHAYDEDLARLAGQIDSETREAISRSSWLPKLLSVITAPFVDPQSYDFRNTHAQRIRSKAITAGRKFERIELLEDVDAGRRRNLATGMWESARRLGAFEVQLEWITFLVLGSIGLGLLIGFVTLPGIAERRLGLPFSTLAWGTRWFGFVLGAALPIVSLVVPVFMVKRLPQGDLAVRFPSAWSSLVILTTLVLVVRHPWPPAPEALGTAIWGGAALALVLALCGTLAVLAWALAYVALPQRARRRNAEMAIPLAIVEALDTVRWVKAFDLGTYWRDALMRDLEAVADLIERGLGRGRTRDPATHEWLGAYTGRMAQGIREMKKRVIHPLPPGATKLDAKRVLDDLEEELFDCLTASLEGRWVDLPQADPPTTPPRSVAVRAIALARTVFVAFLPGAVVFATERLVGLPDDLRTWAVAFAGFWAIATLLLAVDPAADRKVNFMHAVAQTKFPWAGGGRGRG